MKDDDSSHEDRVAARSLNDAWRLRNLAPVGTVSTATTVVRHIVSGESDQCPCSCSAVCGCDTPESAA